eukprot:TRINITY_DN32143_c0_g1_i2.p1 TRINITY_DN32143_c0_g1~~TRINITY_DN32143_c0_g1_i2.p1  ORF type:complete len:475 (+),score=143.64 TRINITY_DN32143_c0_g1_i2:171-1427(+)
MGAATHEEVLENVEEMIAMLQPTPDECERLRGFYVVPDPTADDAALAAALALAEEEDAKEAALAQQEGGKVPKKESTPGSAKMRGKASRQSSGEARPAPSQMRPSVAEFVDAAYMAAASAANAASLKCCVPSSHDWPSMERLETGATLDNSAADAFGRRSSGRKKKERFLRGASVFGDASAPGAGATVTSSSAPDHLRRFNTGSSTCSLSAKETWDALRAAAEEKLERQLREEAEQRKDAAVKALKQVLQELRSPEVLEEAIKAAEEVGLASDPLLDDARQEHEQFSRRYRQQCQEAVLKLQAAIEAPRDDHFGPLVRGALEEREAALKADGGPDAVAAADSENQIWEEVCMVLHLAVVRNMCSTGSMAASPQSMDLLELALEEARLAQLPRQHSLLEEARHLYWELSDKYHFRAWPD